MKIKGIKKLPETYILIKTNKKIEETIPKKEQIQVTQVEEQKVGCFQLVVVKREPWYKKVIKTISGLFKKMKHKTIVIKY